MHTVGKVFMAIGLVILVFGGILLAVGSSNVDDAGEIDVLEKSDWSGQSGSYYFDATDDMMVFVRSNIRCDSFEMTINGSDGNNVYYNDDCTEDGSKPVGWEDDPEGWHHVGTLSTWIASEGTYDINASHEIQLLPMWEVVGEEIGEAVGGFLQGLGGSVLLCCGGVFVIFGLILGFTIGEGGPKVTVIQQGGMPMGQGGQMVQQTTMQQPVYQQVAQTPVQPQTTMQQPAEQTVWEQNSPENPF
tara:strand:- start:63 stop:797 length:735 start_codon:yes stop_codon:yes gene_type:complete